MFHRFISIIIALLISFFSFEQEQSLYRIIEDGKVGYINKNGKVIIPPRFIVADDFWEGLATVRENGLYGFIDKTGKYVVSPKYEKATGFFNGVTTVYNDEKPVYLYRSEGEIKTSKFEIYSLYHTKDKNYIIKGKNGKSGVFNPRTEELVIDTIYDGIFDQYQGIYTVYNFDGEPMDGFYYSMNFSIIDTLGNTILPFDSYCFISEFHNGIAIVSNSNCDYPYSSSAGAIDMKGNFFFKLELAKNEYINGYFNNGLVPIRLSMKRSNAKEKVEDDDYHNTYPAYINLKGEIVLNDTLIEEVSDFYKHRAFIKKEGKYHLINTQMEKVGIHSFDLVRTSSFYNKDYAIVKSENKWGIIDTNGVYIVPPKYEDIKPIYGIKNLFFYSLEEQNDSELYGLSRYDGTVIKEPLFNETHYQNDGILSVEIDNKHTYINTQGEVIWQEKGDTIVLDYNIDYQTILNFYVNDEPKIISKSDKVFIADSLHLFVNTSVIDTFKYNFPETHYEYLSYPVILSNLTSEEVKIRANDGVLYMTAQAIDQDGEWRDISVAGQPRCGNGIRNNTLEKENYWSFEVPVFEGSVKTKLRLKLKYVNSEYSYNPEEFDKGLTIYSNEYEGSINPAQFWNPINISTLIKAKDIRNPY